MDMRAQINSVLTNQKRYTRSEILSLRQISAYTKFGKSSLTLKIWKITSEKWLPFLKEEALAMDDNYESGVSDNDEDSKK